MTAAAVPQARRWSARSTPPGDSAAYRVARPGAALAGRPARPCACAVSTDAAALAERDLGGDYELLFNGVEVERFAKADADADRRARRSSSSAATSRARASTVLLDALRRPARRRPPVGRRRRARRPSALRAALRRRPPHRVARPASPTPRRSARLRGADVFCAPSLRGESFGVVLLEAMAAGHAVVASDLDGYRNVATDGVDALLAPAGRRRRRWPRRCGGCSTTTACARALVAGGRAAGRGVLDGRAWPSATSSVYERLAGAGRAERRRRGAVARVRRHRRQSSEHVTRRPGSSSSSSCWSLVVRRSSRYNGLVRCGTGSRTPGRRSTCSSSAATT